MESKIKNFIKISKLNGPIYVEFLHYEKFSKKDIFQCGKLK